MLFDAMLNEDDMAILQQAVYRALELVAAHGLTLSAGDIAARLCEAYFNGERAVDRLAEAVVKENRVLH